MSDINILKRKITLAAERLAGAALQGSIISEIEHSTAKVFLEMLNKEVVVKIGKRAINPAPLVIDGMSTSHFNIVQLRDQLCLVGVDKQFVATAVAGLTGAAGNSDDQERAVTPTDITLSGVIFHEILSQVFQTPVEANGYETEKAPLVFLLQDARYALLSIAITDATSTGYGSFELVLPLTCIEEFAAPDIDPQNERQIWNDHMREIAEGAKLELDSVIQRVPVSLETILGLKTGDVLEIYEGSLEHLEMAAPTNNGQHVIFKGQLGSLNTHKAFRVSALTN